MVDRCCWPTALLLNKSNRVRRDAILCFIIPKTKLLVDDLKTDKPELKKEHIYFEKMGLKRQKTLFLSVIKFPS